VFPLATINERIAECIKESGLTKTAFAEKLGNNARKLQETLAPEKIYGEWESFIKQIVERN